LFKVIGNAVKETERDIPIYKKVGVVVAGVDQVDWEQL
jgi:hypothetical protein